jgi:hypothetical protein
MPTLVHAIMAHDTQSGIAAQHITPNSAGFGGPALSCHSNRDLLVHPGKASTEINLTWIQFRRGLVKGT